MARRPQGQVLSTNNVAIVLRLKDGSVTFGLGKGDRDWHKQETLRDSVSRDHNILPHDYVGYDESLCISFRMYMYELEMRIACMII